MNPGEYAKSTKLVPSLSPILALLCVVFLWSCGTIGGPYGGGFGVRPFMDVQSLKKFVEGRTLVIATRVVFEGRVPQSMMIGFDALNEETGSGSAWIDLRTYSRGVVPGTWSIEGRDIAVRSEAFKPMYMSFRKPDDAFPSFVFGAVRINDKGNYWDASIHAMALSLDLKRFPPLGELKGSVGIGPLVVYLSEDREWLLSRAQCEEGFVDFAFEAPKGEKSYYSVTVKLVKLNASSMKSAMDEYEDEKAGAQSKASTQGPSTEEMYFNSLDSKVGSCFNTLKRYKGDADNLFIGRQECIWPEEGGYVAASVEFWQSRREAFDEFMKMANISLEESVRPRGTP